MAVTTKIIEPPTIFCDIDGTLLQHEVATFTCEPGHIPKLLPGTIIKLIEWKRRGCKIILTTGRPASREDTEAQLKALGIPYDQLITDVGAGTRVLINDKKSDGTPTVLGFNPDRNHGIYDIEL